MIYKSESICCRCYYVLYRSIINYPTVTELLPNEGSNLNKLGIKLKVSLPGMSARIFLQIGGFIN